MVMAAGEKMKNEDLEKIKNEDLEKMKKGENCIKNFLKIAPREPRALPHREFLYRRPVNRSVIKGYSCLPKPFGHNNESPPLDPLS